MDPSNPVEFREAVAHLQAKGLLPTNLSSAELSQQLSAAFRRQAFFSARNSIEVVLADEKAKVLSIVNPQQVLREGAERTVTEGFNPASARSAIKQLFEDIGYKPEAGTEGTLLDLSSSKRIDLVVKTNVQLAHGTGRFMEQNADADVVDLWPALEFVRFEGRKEPRNWDGMNGLWEQACRRSGDMDALRVFGATGRMCALKSSGVWDQLGNSEYVQGGLDNPFPPFALGSGMWTEEMSREETEEVGLLDKGEKAEPAKFDLASLFGEAA